MKYLLIPIFFALAKAQSSCTGVPDGTVINWGCRSYTVCQDEKSVIIDCSVNGQVYNPKIKACDDPENTPAPCGSNRAVACAKAVEGRFADWTEECKFYYTCNDGLYYGHNPCPEGTVFDEALCLCNYVGSVYAPCGTKPDDDNKPNWARMSSLLTLKKDYIN